MPHTDTETDLLLDEGIQLFDDDQSLDLPGEIGDPLRGEGVAHAQAQERCCGKDLAGVLVGNAVGDDPQAPVTHLDAIQRRRLGKGRQTTDALLHDGVALARVGRHHDVLGRIDGTCSSHAGGPWRSASSSTTL